MKIELSSMKENQISMAASMEETHHIKNVGDRAWMGFIWRVCQFSETKVVALYGY